MARRITTHPSRTTNPLAHAIMRSIGRLKQEIDPERHQLRHLSSTQSATPEDSALLGETASIHRDGFSSENE